MRKKYGCRIVFAAALLATLAWSVSASHARGPGGRGGAGRAGGARSLPAAGGGPGLRTDGVSSRGGALNSGLADGTQLQGMLQERTGTFAERSGQVQQNAQNWANQFQNRPQPFTPAWYANHPTAWQYTHPHADAVVVASTAAVAGWIGAAYYAPAGSGGSSTTVVYNEAPAEEAAAATTYGEDTSGTVETEPQAGEWLPVGIYAMSTSPNAPALLMLQLVVDHQGNLRGVYYDSVTNSSHNIVGTLNPETQRAQWQLEASDQVSFQSPLVELTQPTGHVQVNLPAGPQQWQLARMENPAQ